MLYTSCAKDDDPIVEPCFQPVDSVAVEQVFKELIGEWQLVAYSAENGTITQDGTQGTFTSTSTQPTGGIEFKNDSTTFASMSYNYKTVTHLDGQEFIQDDFNTIAPYSGRFELLDVDRLHSNMIDGVWYEYTIIHINATSLKLSTVIEVEFPGSKGRHDRVIELKR